MKAAHPLHVLVVDDHQLNRELLSELLLSRGHRVDTLDRGGPVLPFVQEHRPDLVVLDLRLSDRDGLDVVRLLKADAAAASIPIIAVTAQAFPEDIEAARMAGCSAVFAKPIDTRLFIRHVEDLA